MGNDHRPLIENAENGDQSAQRMAESFVEVYQVTLIRVEQHLEDMIDEAGTLFAEGYKPWQKALHDLMNGTFLLSRESDITDKESFSEALRMFSFNSSVDFLDDICHTIGIKTERSWKEKFSAHVQMLMAALSGDNMAASPA